MSSELNRRTNEGGNPDVPKDLQGPSSSHFAEAPVRLSPLPARNTLLTILFFSALAAAIFYWLFFPPAPPQTSENSPPPNSQAAEQN